MCRPSPFCLAASACRDPANVTINPVAAAIQPILNPVASSIQPIFDAVASAIHRIFDPVALSVQTVGQAISTGRFGSIGPAVQPVIDGISSPVETIIDVIAPAIKTIVDAIATAVQSVVDPVAEIGGLYGRNAEHECQAEDSPELTTHLRTSHV